MARGWRFEVEPTSPPQLSLIHQHFGARRFADNWALARVKADLDAKATDPSVPTLAWTLPTLRKAWNQAKTEVAPWWPSCSKEAYQAAIGRVRPMLSYKCTREGGTLVVADRWFASSKTHHGRACETSEDHDEVAEADDTRTDPPIVGERNPE